MTTQRHKWKENSRAIDRTVRICERCDLFKITRHEFDAGGKPIHWVEFWRGTERVAGDKTPACVAIEQSEAA